MIYLAAVALLLTVFGFVREARRNGFREVFLDMIFTIPAGFAAGLSIGFGARVGMAAIAFFNGDAWRFSVAGSLRVILFFASFGIGLGLIYTFLLREPLRRRGLLFGLLITLCTWYPLAEAAAQPLRFHPTRLSLYFFTGIFTALMWLPFAVALEGLLRYWQSRRKVFVSPLCGKKAETAL